MNSNMKIMILAIAPLLTAALWMDQQPAFKPYQEPVLVSPATAVPFAATMSVSLPGDLQNPVTPSAASLAEGKQLFTVQCALCHGETSLQPGLVGTKLKPPPPGLNAELLKQRSDAHIFNAISNGFGRMPPFKAKLSPQERWQLINFLRTRN